ncbi:MAG TPA: M15 family metallopeptidase [Gallionellaceae bacterium]
MRLLLGACLLALSCCRVAAAGEQAAPQTCSYVSFNWNIHQKRAVNVIRVSHPYAELRAEEVDAATGCTVCMEDQQVLQVGTLPPFLVCRKIADKVRVQLERLLAAGEPVLEVTAYRPGRTRNPLDEYGNRTGFSNHAYGAAVDINRSRNGLYEHCSQFGPGCRLIQGGVWQPGNFGTLTGDSAIVRGMKNAGFQWGGEIAGEQKDFMHFSLTGY